MYCMYDMHDLCGQDKQLCIRQHCNFIQRWAFAIMRFLLARATLLPTFIPESLRKVAGNLDQDGERDEASSVKRYFGKWIISVVSICTTKRGIVLLSRCPVKVSVDQNWRNPSIRRSNIDAKQTFN